MYILLGTHSVEAITMCCGILNVLLLFVVVIVAVLLLYSLEHLTVCG